MIFPVEIWGTVGQWASAFATTLSFIGAVIFFARNKLQADRAQANMVGVYLMSDSPLKVRMRNTSASSIYDIRVSLLRRPFKDVLFHGNGTYLVEALPQVKRQWEAAHDHLRLYFDHEIESLAPSGDIVQEFEGVVLSNFHEMHVSFMDASSVRWKLIVSSYKDEQRHKLSRVKFDDGYEREGSRFQAYRDRFRIWKSRKDTRKWLRANR